MTGDNFGCKIESPMEQIKKKLKEHDKLFAKIDKRFDNFDKRFEQVDKRFDKLTDHVLSNTRRLDGIEEKMATKDDINKISNTLDDLVGLMKKRDEEMTFMSDRVTRVEGDVEKIKPLVGLSNS